MLKKLYVIGVALAFIPSALIFFMLFEGDNSSAGVLASEILMGVIVVKFVWKTLQNGTKKPAI